MAIKKSPKQARQLALPEGVQDHMAFQRRFWAAQRVAWIVFALILLACLLGLLGRGGMFSSRTIVVAAGTIEIPSISRWNAPDEIRVALAPASVDEIVYVDARFLEAFSVKSIDPPQKATLQKNGRIGYVFSSDPTTSANVIFRLQTQQPGLRTFLVGIGNDVVERSTFILP